MAVIRITVDDLLERKDELINWRMQQQELLQEFERITGSISDSWTGRTSAELSRTTQRYLQELGHLDDLCKAYIYELEQLHEAYTATEMEIANSLRGLFQ